MTIVDGQYNVTIGGLATAKKTVSGKTRESLWFYSLSYRQLLKSQNGACFPQFVCVCVVCVCMCA